MKLHSKFVWERFETAIKIDRIPLFDVGRSMIDVHWFFFPIKLATLLARGPPAAEHLKPETFNRLGLWHSQLSLTPDNGINDWPQGPGFRF